jgi:hypothetical protein
MKTTGSKDASDIVRARYVEFWPRILDPWTRYLVSARTAFDGDMDKMVIMAVIGLMTLQDKGLLTRNPPSVSYDDLMASDPARAEPRPINVESIAMYTGIPRESVRRKVIELVARKWVARDPRGFLVVLPAAAIDLESLSAQLFELIGHVGTAIEDHQPG